RECPLATSDLFALWYERRHGESRGVRGRLGDDRAAAGEPVRALAVLGEVEPLDLVLFVDPERSEERLQREEDPGGRDRRERDHERDAAKLDHDLQDGVASPGRSATGGGTRSGRAASGVLVGSARCAATSACRPAGAWSGGASTIGTPRAPTLMLASADARPARTSANHRPSSAYRIAREVPVLRRGQRACHAGAALHRMGRDHRSALACCLREQVLPGPGAARRYSASRRNASAWVFPFFAL